MNIIAVSKSLLQIEDGKAYWCSNKKNNAQNGDYVLVYVKSKGISQLYRVIDASGTQSHLNCEIRMMTTIWLQHLITYKVPLSIKEMLLIDRLKNTTAVRRKFQGTTFSLKDDEWKEIMEFLNQSNPEQAFKNDSNHETN